MADEISVVYTRMGKPSLVFRGYQYRIHLKNSKLSRVCVIDKYSKCKEKLKTDLQYDMVSKTDHSFVPNPAGMEVKVKIHNRRKKLGQKRLCLYCTYNLEGITVRH